MKYYIKRELNEYGPYTLADLQRYVAQGNIAPTDLTRSEGLTEWVPVSQVLGTIPAPPAVPAPAHAGGVAYPAAPQQQPVSTYPGAFAQIVAGPVPPDFHWALVLVISFLCGIFRIVWLFVEAAFVKKIRPNANFLVFLIIGKAVEFVGGIIAYIGIIGIAAASSGGNPPAAAAIAALSAMGLVWLAGFVLLYVGIFKMRAALEEYYNTVEPINLRLSGAMTFFFPTFYFQHHFTRIAQWKKTGILQPQ